MSTEFAMMKAMPARPRPLRAVLRTRTGLLGPVVLGLLFTATGCGSSPERNATDFCASYVTVAEQAARVSDPDEMSTSALRKQITTLDEAATDAAEVAPKRIADDVDAVIDPLHTLREDLAGADTRAETNRALRNYGTATEKVRDRQQNLDRWVSEHCGVVPFRTTTTLLPRSGTTTG